MYCNVDMEQVKQLEDKAVEIRKKLCSFIYEIGMGHLGGELSIVDMAVGLYYKYMNYDPKNPKWEKRDRLILSKGHCGETLYTIFSDLGMYTMEYMIEHFETLDTAKFGMHPNRKYVPAIEASTGSLGHGLSIATGLALGARMSKEYWRTFCIIGDGEIQEGSNWEAFMAAGHYQLGNLVAIVDKNRLQMTGFTKDVINIDPLGDKIKAFGWDVIEIQGNDMYEVCSALQSLPPADPETRRKPICIISNTTKGCGVSFMENNAVWHGGGIAKEQLDEALKSIENNRKVR
ncbi:transketolase [Clostridium magnum]|uniref:Transketolase n=1 Tax=Clostridium magnum DSM 2767 TaxID=1121326 RepID=A0A161W2F8_9CLOT|nr:transketolase [Clostridium magnum]KZL89360.1 transketolase [Clostridium magnum DSM 2767]SHI21037.1 transketolase subunit A [Clostridium magnum DSM 2767]